MASTKCEWIPTYKNWQHLKFHPLSSIVDFGAGIDVAALAEHIRVNGYELHEPIIIYHNMILDGRHRRDAAKIAGAEPSFMRFVGSEKDALAFVMKKAHRQHLSASQRAMLAAAMVNSVSGGQEKNSNSTTKAEASRTMNVSTRGTSRAKVVVEKGAKELQEAVRQDVLSVDDAAKIAELPKDEQRAAVKDVKAGKAETATEAVEKKKPGRPLFDDRKFEKKFGELKRMVDERANALGAKGATQQSLHDALNQAWRVFTRWQAERK